jgi:uncharacterized protein YecT (DUF1311 family)
VRIAAEEEPRRKAQIEAERAAEEERQRREAEASRVAKEKQRSTVVETPALAVAATQKTDQEPSLTVFGHTTSKVSGWWRTLPGVLKIVLTIAVAGVLALVFTLGRIGLFTGGESPQSRGLNCKTDTKPVEQAICGDAELSNKDRTLQDLYDQILGGMTGQARTDLIKAEIDWMSKRNQCHDPACIAQSYDARLRELHATARR